ncbi:MAG: hypothetical protein U1F36_22725 [Planctomycetota bacterium]
MFRRLGIPLALCCAVLLFRVASADVGRSGGIVILPNALPLIGVPHEIRAVYEFDWGVDLALQLPTNLGPQVLVVFGIENGTPISIGRIENGVLGIRAGELTNLRRAGVTSFEMLLIDSQQRCLYLDFTFEKGEFISMLVR